MSGDRRLEISAPPEYLAFERGLCDPQPVLFLRSFGVDAGRKCDEVYKIQSRGKPFETCEPLVVPLIFSFIYLPTTFSSLRSHLVWLTFTASTSFTEILKA